MANVVSTTLANAPFFLQKDVGDGDPIYYSAADFRRFFNGVLPRSGILGSSHFLVTQADNVGMAIKVNSGFANVAGLYLVHLPNDLTINLGSFAANPPATRTHKVFLSVYDEQTTSVGGYGANIDVMEDTGAGANYPPSTTSAYLQLATITVAPNQQNIQNANIVNTVRHGGMAGEYVYLAPYLNTGFDTAGSDADTSDFRARYENGRVFLSGAVKRTGGTAFANGSSYDFGVMHSNLRPARTKYITGPCSIYDSQSDSTGTYTWRLSITKDGVMNARLPTGTGPQYLLFDGMSYDLD